MIEGVKVRAILSVGVSVGVRVSVSVSVGVSVRLAQHMSCICPII